MKRDIFINIEGSETRVAIKEDDRLSEIHIERGDNESLVGNIYKGKVTDVLPGMEAAFVDIGLERNVFLHVSDCQALKKDSTKVWPIKSLLQKGQEVMVQVVKEPMGTKGARVTCDLTIPGRYLVLMINVNHAGISRRIVNEKERNRLKSILSEIKTDKFGLIARTVAEGATKEQLLRDFRFLQHQWQKVINPKRKKNSPVLLYKDVDLIQRMVRDVFTQDFDRLVIDNMLAYKEVIKLTRVVAPHLRGKVELYQGPRPIFCRFEVEDEINKALQRKVWLRSGGYLIIDPTEALTSIDVNTGKYVGSKNLDDTILKINLEAAKEIPRQLRLRDLGGIIIIDFIDMEREKDKEEVLELLDAELNKDKTKTSILGLTKLGLVEMTRKKVKLGIGEYLQQQCDYCGGTGLILSPESVALETIHQLKKKMAQERFKSVLIEVNPEVASIIIGPGGKNLKQWEKELKKDIYIRGNENLHLEEIKILKTGSRQLVAEVIAPVKKGDILELTIQSQHTYNNEDGIARIEGFVIDVLNGGELIGEKVEVEIEEVFRTYAQARIVDKK